MARVTISCKLTGPSRSFEPSQNHDCASDVIQFSFLRCGRQKSKLATELRTIIANTKLTLSATSIRDVHVLCLISHIPPVHSCSPCPPARSTHAWHHHSLCVDSSAGPITAAKCPVLAKGSVVLCVCVADSVAGRCGWWCCRAFPMEMAHQQRNSTPQCVNY